MEPHHHATAPAPTIVAWALQVPLGAAVLDVAAGGGRHARRFAERGHAVTAVDRDTEALHRLGDPRIEVVTADLENGPWPLPGRVFGAVVVVDYLWRPLLPVIVASVAPGGLLLYETFAVGNECFGRPRNPDFLLRPGELRDAVRGELDVLDYAHGEVGEPARAVRQRLLARRAAS
jgi:SAM-dependent methyltransferase